MIIYGNIQPGYAEIYLDWANIEGTLLRAGTPVSAAGVIDNSGSVFGILPNDVGKTEPNRPISVIVSGLLYLPDIEASFGAALADECKAALDQISFVKADGTIDVVGGMSAADYDPDGDVAEAGGIPDYVEAAIGDIPTKAMVVTYDDDTTETFNVLIEATE